MEIKERVLIGQLLVDAKVITPEQLEVALQEQRKKGEFLCTTIVRLGLAPERLIFPALASQLGIPHLNLANSHIDPAAVERVSAKYATYYRLMPIALENGVLTVAIADPLNVRTLDDLKLLLGLDVRPVLASESDILEAIRRHYGVGAETVERMLETTTPMAAPSPYRESVENLEAMAEDASVVRLVNQLLQQALQERATDIHVEPFQDDIRVRFRSDRVLHEVAIPPTMKHFHGAVVSRIKVMSNLDIAERRLPQDGRIRVKLQANELDLRVSILPSTFGESVHLRILSSAGLLPLDRLGLLGRDQEILERMIKKPHGIIFVTGPTGSGKTTTLYACLTKINVTQTKVVTIEDPVEYEIRGITQIQVHPKINLTFAQGLRSMLRHDPDVMMIGEVRDYDTAEIAIRAALTGHLVFSTLHTNDAAGAVTRLIDMGVEPFLVASSVECLIAQRLVRLICLKCKVQVPPSKVPSLLAQLGVPVDSPSVELVEGKGCEECKMTGYRGRTAIYEFLVMSDPIREMVLKSSSSTEIKRKAVSLGMRTLRDDGWEKVRMGQTTVPEVVRVAQEDDFIPESDRP